MKFNTQNLPKCEECIIRKASLFGKLENAHLDKARSLRSSQVTLAAGEYLYFEGDIPEKAYTLYQGWIILFKNLEGGERQILRFGLPGDLLCFTSKNLPLDHSAVALTSATLCAFPLEGFKRTITQLPELFFAISAMSDTTTQRCYATLTAIANHGAEAKIAFLILGLYIRLISLQNNQSDSIFFPITQDDIGDALGLTSVHVNRVIQILREKKLIELKSKNLRVLNKSALAKVANVNLDEIEELMIAI